MKNLIRTQFDPSYEGSLPEKNTEPSMTQPDMTLSMRELLINHTRGLGIMAKHHEGFYYDTEIPQFDDMTDIDAYREYLAEQKAENDKRVEELLTHKRKFDEQVRERQKAINSQSSTQESSKEVSDGETAI